MHTIDSWKQRGSDNLKGDRGGPTLSQTTDRDSPPEVLLATTNQIFLEYPFGLGRYLVGGQDLPGEILTPLYQISGSLSQALPDIWLPCQISDGPPHTGTDIRRQAGPRYLHGQHSLPDIWKGGRDLKLDILTPLCQISAS